jgi:hypothetical protein
MLNLPRFAARVAITAVAGALSACGITFGIANAPTAFGAFERKANIAYDTDVLTSTSSAARTDPSP